MTIANAYKKILIAVDLSSDARKVVQRAMDMAACFGAKLQLIHVIEPIDLNSPYELSTNLPTDMQSVLVARAEEFLARLAQDFNLSDTPRSVEVGSLKNTILETAANDKIDLIVIGTHGRHGIGLLLGSTATSVLHGTPCDIYAVKM